MMKQKAEIGIGTLIIFIAMILVAAIAAGVLLQTASALQNKALVTGERSKVQVSTGLMTTLLYAEEGTNRNLEVLCQKIKLQPGSDGIKFGDTLLEIHTKNASSSKIYGYEVDENITNTTWTSLGVDMDEDDIKESAMLLATDIVSNASQRFGLPEYLENLSGSAYLLINVTNGTGSGPYYFALRLGKNLTSASSSNKIELDIFDTYINNSAGQSIGSIAIIGKTGTSNTLEKDMYIFAGDATVGADGAYSVEYLIKGALYRPGYLNRGDVVRICYAAPRELEEDEDIIINIVPKTGSISRLQTSLPDVITNQRVYIYP